MECEICKKSFVSKYSLANHQRTAKFCLKIKGEENTEFKCEHCDKVLSTKLRLDTHMKVCSNSVTKPLYDRIKELEAKVEQLENKLKRSSAHQPLDLSKANIRKLLTGKLSDVKLDQEGVADIVFKHLLVNSDGHVLYKCSDTSRQKFVYYDTLGIKVIDIKATKLIKSLYDSEIIEDILDMCYKEYTATDNMETLIDRSLLFTERQRNIVCIRNDDKNFDFRKKLVDLS